MNPTMIEVEELSSTNNHGSSPCGTGNPTAALEANPGRFNSAALPIEPKMVTTNLQTPEILPRPFRDMFLKYGELKILEPQDMMYISRGGVDASCSLPNARVLQRGEHKLTTTVVKVDINSGENIFHTFQILSRKIGDREEYHIFHSCGLIGEYERWTTLEKNSHQDVCYDDYMNYYKEYLQQKSWTLIAVDCGCDIIRDFLPRTLDEPVKDLLESIFNIDDGMIIGFKTDPIKLPLGKLHEHQYDKAFEALRELLVLIRNGEIDSSKLVDLSNKLYALIPQRFPITGPELLDTEEKVCTRKDTLETLRNMNSDYTFLNADTLAPIQRNPLKVRFENLRTEIRAVDESTNEFSVIQRYVSNSHGQTHGNYTLELCQVFRINRHGEKERYRQFRNVENRTLLWHGTRRSNLESILRHGLTVQQSGNNNLYGRGLYFADRVSKAAKYSHTSRKDENLTLLLCEVALGNMEELSQGRRDETLPPGRLSRVGLGKRRPDPNENVIMPNGLRIPCGTDVQSSTTCDLEYNEYVVYNDAQVKIKYLVIVAKNDIKQSFEL